MGELLPTLTCPRASRVNSLICQNAATILGIAQGSNTYSPPVYTGGGLRHPAFKGMRIDKTADDVDLPGRH
ncbi:hypothetical protein C1M55_31135 (plasmid) [Rhodococcus qingshengii]|nr:hypothetical protein C1M55_31135 [Rhodococcus qingshengii]